MENILLTYLGKKRHQNISKCEVTIFRLELEMLFFLYLVGQCLRALVS